MFGQTQVVGGVGCGISRWSTHKCVQNNLVRQHPLPSPTAIHHRRFFGRWFFSILRAFVSSDRQHLHGTTHRARTTYGRRPYLCSAPARAPRVSDFKNEKMSNDETTATFGETNKKTNRRQPRAGRKAATAAAIRFRQGECFPGNNRHSPSRHVYYGSAFFFSELQVNGKPTLNM